MDLNLERKKCLKCLIFVVCLYKNQTFFSILNRIKVYFYFSENIFVFYL